VTATKKDYEVLAAGPFVGGPMTVPSRLVCLRWKNGQHSVHRQQEGGELTHGDYFGEKRDFALFDFIGKLEEEVNEYGDHILKPQPQG
jgi:hypothetical protein